MTPTNTITYPSTPRAANAAIAGYAYQFDKTVLEILDAESDDVIVVEGCEDIDLHTAGEATAVQCKYHEAGRFSPSGIRKPLLLMLDAFAQGRTYRYKLYAHYGSDVPGAMPSTLTVDELKQVLTEQKRKPTRREVRHYEKFDDATLAAFSEQFSAEEGPTLQDQRSAVGEALCEALSCSAEDVADLHYTDAFVLIMQTAMNADPSQRSLTRASFIDALDKRHTMFTRWHSAFLGEERYVKAVKKQVKTQGLLRSTASRTLILGAGELATETTTTRVPDLLAGVAQIGYGPGTLRTARPWTVVLDAPPERAREIKTALVARDMMLHDGFEDLGFSSTLFDRGPLVTGAGSKVTDTSYDLRIFASRDL
jgi:hypothetical protein